MFVGEPRKEWGLHDRICDDLENQPVCGGDDQVKVWVGSGEKVCANHKGGAHENAVAPHDADCGFPGQPWVGPRVGVPKEDRVHGKDFQLCRHYIWIGPSPQASAASRTASE